MKYRIFKIMLIKTKMLKNKDLLAFKLSDVVFIMLIHVNINAIICWHFNIYEQDKFRAQLS